MNLTPVVLVVGAALPGALLWMAPAFRRKAMLFGVHVAPEWTRSPEAQRIVMIYRLQIAAWLLIEVVLALRHFFASGALLLTMGAATAFTIASRSSQPYKVPVTPLRSASLRPDDNGSIAETIAALLPLLLLALTAVWMYFHWDQIPERFPVHYDLQGHANRWSIGHGVASMGYL